MKFWSFVSYCCLSWFVLSTSVEMNTTNILNRSAFQSANSYCQHFNYIIKSYAKTNKTAVEIYVVFRSLRFITDWIVHTSDELTSYRNCENCKVHSVLYAQIQNMTPSILDVLTELTFRYDSYQIVFTGHGVGGGWATLAALDVVTTEIHLHNISLVTFGAPRVGNREFALFATEQLGRSGNSVARVTHNRDFAVHYPRRNRGYCHIGGERYENSSGGVRVCSGLEDPQCAEQWSAAETSASDHLRYLGRVMQCKDSQRTPQHSFIDERAGFGDSFDAHGIIDGSLNVQTGPATGGKALGTAGSNAIATPLDPSHENDNDDIDDDGNSADSSGSGSGNNDGNGGVDSGGETGDSCGDSSSDSEAEDVYGFGTIDDQTIDSNCAEITANKLAFQQAALLLRHEKAERQHSVIIAPDCSLTAAEDITPVTTPVEQIKHETIWHRHYTTGDRVPRGRVLAVIWVLCVMIALMLLFVALWASLYRYSSCCNLGTRSRALWDWVTCSNHRDAYRRVDDREFPVSKNMGQQAAVQGV